MVERVPVVFGLVGLGGFASAVLGALRKLEAATPARIKLVAACEPAQELHRETIARLRAEGVTVVRDLQELLQLPIQALWMPVPVHLHRPFVEAAVAAGKWVICEKPAAGTLQEIDAMRAVRERYQGKLAIAFQDIHERFTPRIKQKLLEGAIGRIQDVSVVCCWSRPQSYFNRSNWAGRLRVGESWVLDSPCTNAMAHFINLALFLLGPDLDRSATPVQVEAELYRARKIPSADTTCIRARLQEGNTALFLMTHACSENYGPETIIRGELGEVHLTATAAEFRYHDGRRERVEREVDIARTAEVALDHWVDHQTATPLAGLELARQHTLLANGAFDATPIHSVPERFVAIQGRPGDPQPCIPGIETLLQQCAKRMQLPQESGQIAWSRPAGRLELRGYDAFAGRYCRTDAMD